MRIGTWNLYLRAHSPTAGWRSKAAWLDEQPADIWLLTEVSDQWHPRNGRLIVSPNRRIGPDHLRWAAIETTLPVANGRTAGDLEHPGEEGLALARIQVHGLSVLVACTVLPYKKAQQDRGGLSGSREEQFREVLSHHVARMTAERESPDEPLIWGGDFNQELVRPYIHGSASSVDDLRSALDTLGLTALTAGLAERTHRSHAIDHLAVSSHFLAERVEVHRPERGGDKLGDHAAYTAVLNLIAP